MKQKRQLLGFGGSKPKNVVTPASTSLSLLLTDKVDQMASIDTLINLLIRKGVFTKEEFLSMKQRIKNTDKYKQIKETTDGIVESLNPETIQGQLSAEELNDLMAIVSEK